MQNYRKVISFILTLAIVITALVIPPMVVPAYAEDIKTVYITTQVFKADGAVLGENEVASNTDFRLQVGVIGNPSNVDSTLKNLSMDIEHSSEISFTEGYSSEYIIEPFTITKNSTKTSISASFSSGLVKQGNADYVTKGAIFVLTFSAVKGMTKDEFKTVVDSIVLKNLTNNNNNIKLMPAPYLEIVLKNSPGKLYSNTDATKVIAAIVSSASFTDKNGNQTQINLANIGDENEKINVVIPADVGVSLTAEGTDKIFTIQYKSASGEIAKTTVTAKVYLNTVKGLNIETAPNKTEYNAGECFATAGMVVKATKEDNSVVDVITDDGISFNPSLTTPLGKNVTSIAITYGDKTVYQPITVSAVDGTLTINSIANVVYSGTAIKPALSFDDSHKNMVEGVDYTVEITSNTAVGTAYLTVSALDSGSYTFNPVSTTFNIARKTITLGALTANNKYFDNTTKASIAISTNLFEGAYSGDVSDLDLSYNAYFSDEKAGNDKTVTIESIELTGNAASNYTLADKSSKTSKANILKAKLGITGLTVKEKTYSGDNITVEFCTDNLELTGVASSTDVTISGISGKYYASKNGSEDKSAGQKYVKIDGYTLVGSDKDNYELSDSAKWVSAVIKPAPVTIKAIEFTDKTYDGTTYAEFPNVTLSGVLNGDVVTGVAIGYFAGSTVNDHDTGGNGYKKWGVTITGMIFGGKDGDNYYLSETGSALAARLNSVSFQASILPGQVTPIAIGVQDIKPEEPNISFYLNELVTDVPEHDIVSITASATGSNPLENISISDAGFHYVTISGVSTKVTDYAIVFTAGNGTIGNKCSLTLTYTFKNYNEASVKVDFEYKNITSIKLRFTGDMTSKVYNGKQVTLSVERETSAGSNEYISVTDGVTYTHKPKNGGTFENGLPSNAGEYFVRAYYRPTATGTDAQLSGYCTGEVTINKKQLNVTYSPSSATYTGNNITVTCTCTDFNQLCGSDNIGNIAVSLSEKVGDTYLASVTVVSQAGTYKIIATPDNNNYYIPEYMYTVNKAYLSKDDFNYEYKSDNKYDPEIPKNIEVNIKDSIVGAGDVKTYLELSGAKKYQIVKGYPYALDSYTQNNPVKINAGSYDVIAEVTDGKNYNNSAVSVGSFTISKIKPDDGRFSLNQTTTKAYDGTPLSLSIIDKYEAYNDGIGTKSLKYGYGTSTNTDALFTTDPVNAGTYTVFAANTGGVNYYDSVSYIGTIRIDKAEVTTASIYYLMTPSTIVFDGNDHIPTITSTPTAVGYNDRVLKYVNGGASYYTYTPAGAELGDITLKYMKDGGAYITSTPNAVGKYQVYAYSIAETTNYNATSPAWLLGEFEITKGGLNASHFKVDLSHSNSYDGDKYTFNDTYDGKARVVTTTALAASVTYTTEIKYKKTSTSTLENATSIKNAGTYYVYAKITANASYDAQTVTIATIVMNKKTPALSDLVYTVPTTQKVDNNTHTATVKATNSVIGMGTITLKYKKDYNAFNGSPKEVGYYQVFVNIAEGDNYTAYNDLSLGSFNIQSTDVQQKEEYKGGGGTIGGGGGFSGGGGGGGGSTKKDEEAEAKKKAEEEAKKKAEEEAKKNKQVSTVWIDVLPDKYYYEPMQWCFQNNIMDASSAIMFGIGRYADRSDLIVALYRASGSPNVSSTVKLPFTDVKETDACYEAVRWAYSKGVVGGTTATTFSPTRILCRSDLVTLLWNFDGRKIQTGTKAFKDVAKNSYYTKAVDWATATGLVNGATENTFDPTRDIVKEDTITFYYRYFVESLND